MGQPLTVYAWRTEKLMRSLLADIISRSSTEIIKNCFGDDQEEAKSMPWTREQVWFLVKKLSKAREVGLDRVWQQLAGACNADTYPGFLCS